MYKGGYDWSKPFRKSARIVGDVIGKYHPHGDQSVYDALSKISSRFFNEFTFNVQGQGNFGSIDGDPPAAMRYTLKLSLAKVAQYLTEDLEKNTVNYRRVIMTKQKKNLTVLTMLNIQIYLVNGAGGIAVGMATSIPPHNLGEVVNATISVI